jgi:hypothetical protein
MRSRRCPRAAYLCDELGLGSRRVLARELDLVDPVGDIPDREPRMLHDLGRLEVKLPLHVDRARREKDVDSTAYASVRQRLDGGVEVLVTRARERRDGRMPDGAGDGANPFELTRRGNGEARLDDIDAEPVESLRDLHLLIG